MTAVLFAICGAVLVGSADFGMGLAARRRGLPVALVGPQLTATLLLVAAAALFSHANFASGGLPVAIAACRAAGITLLARALVIGPVSIVSPVSGMNGLVPLSVGLAMGNELTVLQGIGIVLCLAGLVLVTSTAPSVGEGTRRRLGIVYALGALVALGGEIALIGIYAHRVQPLIAAANIQVVGLIFLWVIAAFAARRGSRASESMTLRNLCSPPLVLVGAMQAAGTGLYVGALGLGQLSTVGVLISTYPAATVLLARAVLHERPEPRHAAGGLLMLLGIVGVAT
jgi:drug/metabolite transporter (DMT)-like permease